MSAKNKNPNKGPGPKKDKAPVFFDERKSWFAEALKELGVKEGPAWPDRFGAKMRAWLDKNSPEAVSTLSLFTGAGGLDIGFTDAGFHSKEMVEVEKRFVATLDENSKNGGYLSGAIPRCIDIRNYKPDKKDKVDFIIGGPPCQTFSSAGRRASGVQGTDDPRGMLFVEYVRLLKILKPKGFLFENVYGITGAQGGEAWRSIQKAFRDAGYKIFYRVLDAADYGVPQHRERLFIVGLREGEFRFPYPTHGPDSSDKRPHYSAGVAVSNAEEGEPLKRVNGRYGHLLDEIPPGLNYSFFTKKLGHPKPVFAWRSKFSDFLYKADPAMPVRAIKAQGGQYTGPFSWENRYFTVAELKRLQTFPDNFRLVGGRQVAIHQIGNSVPSQLGRIMGLAILDQVFGVKLPFKIRYMDSGHELGFRNRKRNMTKLYEDRARAAISRLVTKKGPKRTDTPATLVRFQDSRFRWSAKEIKDSIRFEIHRSVEDGVLSLRIGPAAKQARFTVEITPTSGSADWGIPYPKIVLSSVAGKRGDIYPLWRTLEEVIQQESGIADLVQFSGYYQYAPSIRVKLDYKKVSDADVGFWRFWERVAQAGRSLELHIDEFGALTGIARNSLEEVFSQFREVGFEVRNSNTNPQMARGNYLVPYIFPTLKPDSVQLNKKL